jgi:hypothetical protein
LNHVNAKPFVDRHGYSLLADYNLQGYAGTLSWHTGYKTMGCQLYCSYTGFETLGRLGPGGHTGFDILECLVPENIGW